jgi:MFS family permease
LYQKESVRFSLLRFSAGFGMNLATPVIESLIFDHLRYQNLMSSPSIRSTLLAALLLTLIGWIGLAYLFIFTLPTLWPRWLFFFLTIFAITGICLPVMAFLNRRFTTQPPATFNSLLREAALVGVYFATLAWLQLGRVLSMPLMLLLAIGLILIEFLIRLREKSRWEP